MQSGNNTLNSMLRAFSSHRNNDQNTNPVVSASLVLKNESNIHEQQGLAFFDDSANSRAETSNGSESSMTSHGYYSSDEDRKSEGFKLDEAVIRSENSGVDPSRFLKDSKVIFKDVSDQHQKLKEMHNQYCESVKKKFPYAESDLSYSDLEVKETTDKESKFSKTIFNHVGKPGEEYSITAEVTKFNDPKPILFKPDSEPLFGGKSTTKEIS